MQFVLLTHPREIQKSSNTGQLVISFLSQLPQYSIYQVQRILWQRKQPDAELLNWLKTENLALLYPEPGPEQAPVCEQVAIETLGTQLKSFSRVILIDSSWQEAQKIYNQSPYLQALPRLQLVPGRASIFRMRKHQREGGLSTLESVAQLLFALGEEAMAKALLASLESYQAQWLLGRNPEKSE